MKVALLANHIFVVHVDVFRNKATVSEAPFNLAFCLIKNPIITHNQGNKTWWQRRDRYEHLLYPRQGEITRNFGIEATHADCPNFSDVTTSRVHTNVTTWRALHHRKLCSTSSQPVLNYHALLMTCLCIYTTQLSTGTLLSNCHPLTVAECIFVDIATAV